MSCYKGIRKGSMMQLRLRIWADLWESLKGWWEGKGRPAEQPLDLEAALARHGSGAGGL